MMKFDFIKSLDVIVATFLIIGGLNWGLVGLFGFDPIASIFGSMSILSRVFYGIVGICALYQAVQVRAIPRRWSCVWPKVAQDATT